MITTFLPASTKDNFKFFCDECLTMLENSLAESDTQKINSLEKKYIEMESKLDEIKGILLKKKNEAKTDKAKGSKGSIWHHKEKLETV